MHKLGYTEIECVLVPMGYTLISGPYFEQAEGDVAYACLDYFVQHKQRTQQAFNCD